VDPEGKRVSDKKAPSLDPASILTPSIVNPRLGIQFCFKLFQLIFNDVSGDLTIGIIEISEHSDPCHTGRHTGRFFTLFHELDTETALFDITFLLNDPDIIRTSRDTIFTADTLILIHQDDAILPLMGGTCWTDFHTGWVIAMLALDRQKFTGIVRKIPVFPFLKMVIGLRFFKAILVMTGNTTRMTAHTF